MIVDEVAILVIGILGVLFAVLMFRLLNRQRFEEHFSELNLSARIKWWLYVYFQGIWWSTAVGCLALATFALVIYFGDSTNMAPLIFAYPLGLGAVVIFGSLAVLAILIVIEIIQKRAYLELPRVMSVYLRPAIIGVFFYLIGLMGFVLEYIFEFRNYIARTINWWQQDIWYTLGENNPSSLLLLYYVAYFLSYFLMISIFVIKFKPEWYWHYLIVPAIVGFSVPVPFILVAVILGLLVRNWQIKKLLITLGILFLVTIISLGISIL